MVILIEGIDGTGKSTLAGKLSKMYNWPILHFTSKDRTEEDFLNTLRGGGKYFVSDRSHWSELAYGPVFRGRSELDDVQMQTIDEWLLARRAVVVFCALPLEKAFSNQEKRAGEFHGDSRQEEVLVRYTKLIGKTPFPVMVYNYEMHGLSKVTDFVARHSGERV